MIAATAAAVTPNALEIPYVNADEAHKLLSVEFERFLALVDTLEAGDWAKPTACTKWSVRDILAHQAGGYTGGTSYREIFRQTMIRPQPGQLIEDAINDQQLAERAGKTPQELLVELRRVGPVAIEKWAYKFRFGKLFGIPHPIPGFLTLRYLMWVTHSRDTWMHRLDICRATGKAFVQTPEHDGRIAALVVRDVGRQLEGKLDGKAILFDLGGVAGGAWQVGRGQPAATVQMDMLDFCIFASGRFNYEEARKRATITGDVALAEAAMKKILILF